MTKSTGSTILIRREPGVVTPGSAVSNYNTTNNSINNQLDSAEVVDIILNSSHPDFINNYDIGKIKIKILGTEKGNVDNSLSWAWPINSYFISYPIKHEIVTIIKILDRYFYYTAINYNNNINNNSYPGIGSSPVDNKNNTGKSYSNSESVGIPNKRVDGDDLGDYFEDENKKIKQIEPSEGDVILRGRFGQTIKMSKNIENNTPNIKLSVGQTSDIDSLSERSTYLENIDNTPSILWLTNEKINLTPITQGKSYHLKSVKDSPIYEDNQVIINTDGIIFNTKKNEQLFFSNKGIALCTNGYIAIDSYKDIGITTVNKINIVAQNGMYVDSKEILLGKNASESIVLGNKLVKFLEELLDELSSETHPTGTGPSGIPINSIKYKNLKIKAKTILSKQNKTL